LPEPVVVAQMLETEMVRVLEVPVLTEQPQMLVQTEEAVAVEPVAAVAVAV
jgi:hypothetical protein